MPGVDRRAREQDLLVGHVAQALHDAMVRRRQQQQLDLLVRALEPQRERLDDAQRDLGPRAQHRLERLALDHEQARVGRARPRSPSAAAPLRIAISPKNSPGGSTASTRSVSPTMRRISTSPV